MSYNQQSTIADEEIIHENEGEIDQQPRTRGSLVFGAEVTDNIHKSARSFKVSADGELFIESIEMKQLLTDILIELKKQSVMLSMVVDAEITDLEIGGDE